MSNSSESAEDFMEAGYSRKEAEALSALVNETTKSGLHTFDDFIQEGFDSKTAMEYAAIVCERDSAKDSTVDEELRHGQQVGCVLIFDPNMSLADVEQALAKLSAEVAVTSKVVRAFNSELGGPVWYTP